MKKILCLFMVLLLSASVVHFYAAEEYTTYRDYFPFEDISADSWYTPAVEFCYANTYMRGVSNSTFDPSSVTTREQTVMILANMTAEDISQFTASSFKDIKEGKWYSNAVSWAKEKGYISGIGGGRFGLGLKITREEAVTVFYNYVRPSTSDSASGGDLSGFADSDKISSWAMDAMLWAVSEGVINGNQNNMIDPKGILTRAQAAQLIYNIQLNCINIYHKHDFADASCTEPSRCKVDGCRLLLTPAKGHRTASAQTCESYESCLDCGALVYSPKGHIYKAASCTEPMTCVSCGNTEGEALGHTNKESVCLRCNKEFFGDDYSKLVYYLKSKGDYRGTAMQLHAHVIYDNGDFAEQFAGYDLSENYCYLKFIYRFAKTGDVIELKLKFDSIREKYNYAAAYSKNEKIEFSGNGTLDASALKNGTPLTLTSYSGKERYKKDLEKLCSPTLSLMLDAADRLLSSNCNMGIAALGFMNF